VQSKPNIELNMIVIVTECMIISLSTENHIKF